MRRNVRSHNYLCLIGIALLAMGCDQISGERVEALLRVNRQSESPQDYQVYRKTQAALLTSQFVVEQAVRSLKAEQQIDVSVDWLVNSIGVALPDTSELILVYLPIEGRKVGETEFILDSVVRAYETDIVNKERLERVEYLGKLRNRHRILVDRLQKKTDEIGALSRELGVSSRRKLVDERGQKRSDHLYPRLIDLSLRKIQLAQTPDAEKELAVVEEQIEFIEERLVAEESSAQDNPVTSGALEVRVEDLAALRKDMATVRKDMQQLEIELDGPQRVTVIQGASSLE